MKLNWDLIDFVKIVDMIDFLIMLLVVCQNSHL
jgi:hypothetical protein